MRAARATLLLACGAIAGSCGGGGSPSGPTPTPVPGHPVAGSVFYDENANGVPDASEVVRLPGVTVSIGGRSGQSGPGGRFVVDDVPAGAQVASLRAESLPAYFTPGASVPVSVPPPAGSEVSLPATLATGGNRPNVYMAIGDSITTGEGSSNGGGYRDPLRAALGSYLGKATLIDEGMSGAPSFRGEQEMGPSLGRDRPAYSLILFGTNDWNKPECRSAFPCFTVDSLRSMILQARDASSFAVLGTIPPVNPRFADRDPEARNDWVRRMNDALRAMARQENVPIADIHDAFLKQPSLPALFDDFLHPNDEGYALVAQAWFRAVIQPIAVTNASGRLGSRGLPRLLLAPGARGGE